MKIKEGFYNIKTKKSKVIERDMTSDGIVIKEQADLDNKEYELRQEYQIEKAAEQKIKDDAEFKKWKSEKWKSEK